MASVYHTYASAWNLAQSESEWLSAAASQFGQTSTVIDLRKMRAPPAGGVGSEGMCCASIVVEQWRQTREGG